MEEEEPKKEESHSVTKRDTFGKKNDIICIKGGVKETKKIKDSERKREREIEREREGERERERERK